MRENDLAGEDGTSNRHRILTSNEKIIVIGASAGGFEAFKTIVKGLPPDFSAPIFIVWHMSANVRGVLPNVLNKEQTVYAADAYDMEEISSNRIYVAPPDHHLLLEEGRVRLSRGPKENRFRPAIDPLFRSAAYAYGNRVVGVILSGALDDGSAGLWSVKHYGGIAVVQDPDDAEVRSMPENARRQVDVDYCVPVSEVASLLIRLSKEKITENIQVMKEEITKAEIEVAKQKNSADKAVYYSGELTPYTCPECHGVLAKLSEGKMARYRCHTGHAYSVDTLIAAITEGIENGLYNAMRGIEESIMLLNHMGDHFAEVNNPKLAAVYFKKAKEAEDRAATIRKTVMSHELLSKDKLFQEADEVEQ